VEYLTEVTDVLVLGSGAAGCLAALEAAEHTARVVLVNKGALGRTGNTNLATVTLAAAVGHGDPEDSPEVHWADTIVGGHYLGNQELARIMCEEAPKEVYHLNRLGMPWDALPDGRFDLRPMPGFTYPRGVYYDGKTGKTLQVVLARAVLKQPKIRVINDFHAFWIVRTAQGETAGVLGYDASHGCLVLIKAKAVVIATGGAGRIYHTSTMETGSTGDGIAMAYRAGAELVDMEFHQIFPTGFVWPECLRGILVASSVLWSRGLRLYNAAGERFMERYDPIKLENCPRDMLSRAVYREIAEGRGTSRGGVWLDTYHVDDWDAVRTEFAKVYIRPQALGIDTRRIEVAPTYHYTMGGVRFDVHGETTVPRLFVAGEAGGGVHGANRLGGNALAECAVFGVRAGRQAAKYRSQAVPEASPESIERGISFFRSSLGDGSGRKPHQLRADLNRAATSFAWVSRTADGLIRGLDAVEELREESRHLSVSPGMVYNPELIEALQLSHMLLLSDLIFRSALLREETRGAHHREDHPETDNGKWLVNIIVREGGDGGSETLLEPVDLARFSPEDDQR
jgi:fumarate reductase (CoM/CoB) subunit A